TNAGGSAHKSGSKYLERSYSVESARLASAARANAGAAHRAHVPLRRANLPASFSGQDAAAEKSRAGHGQHPGLRRYLRSGAGPAHGEQPTTAPNLDSNRKTGVSANRCARGCAGLGRLGCTHRGDSTPSRALPRPSRSGEMVRRRKRARNDSVNRTEINPAWQARVTRKRSLFVQLVLSLPAKNTG